MRFFIAYIMYPIGDEKRLHISTHCAEKNKDVKAIGAILMDGYYTNAKEDEQIEKAKELPREG
jgi:hypothetical protein